MPQENNFYLKITFLLKKDTSSTERSTCPFKTTVDFYNPSGADLEGEWGKSPKFLKKTCLPRSGETF
jgi:hypothetical protein